MSEIINILSVVTENLPNEAFYPKLFPIFKKRIEDRCATKCVENAAQADYTVTLQVVKGLPAEGFEIKDSKNGVTVSGGDFLSVLYGIGQFLHKSHYKSETVVPTGWRGISAPDCEKRMVFFAQHFYNWYQCCSAQEIREHIEDLALWGINGVVSVFSCLNLTSWEDPNLKELSELFIQTLSAAKELNLKVGMEYSNIDFINYREDIRADYKYLVSHTGNLVCPSNEEGFAYYKEMLRHILEYTKPFGGLDFITIWGYDEGGCCCDKCWPWGAKGFYNMAHRISKDIREWIPGVEIWLATWYFGRGKHQKDEWQLFYDRLKEDSEKGDNWVDYLLLETRDDFTAMLYPAKNGAPTENIKMLTFPDVSMTGVVPWGGMGAIATPTLMKRQEKPFMNLCSGGYMYTEGIYDDMNKVIQAGIYWDRKRTTEETIKDYCGYEFKGINGEDLVHLVDLIEASQMYTNRFDRNPCPLTFSELALNLAEKMDNDADKSTKGYWRWRIVYIRAYLDYIRYKKCAELGWPIKEEFKGVVGMTSFWGKMLKDDQKAQDLLLELIKIYKAQEINDQSIYKYHWYVRPPMWRGIDDGTKKNKAEATGNMQ